jgi:hypothetical protein
MVHEKSTKMEGKEDKAPILKTFILFFTFCMCRIALFAWILTFETAS